MPQEPKLFTSLQRSLLTWLLIFLAGWALLAATDYFGEVVTLLVTAGLIAFVLNYPVSLLARSPYLPRPLVAIAVYLAAGLGLTLLAITLLPPLIDQSRQLIVNLPQLVKSAQMQVVEFQEWADARNWPIDLRGLERQLGEQVQQQARTIASRGFNLVLGTFSRLLDVILVLVISFYMLLGGDRLWRSVTSILSPSIRDQLSRSLQTNLRGFFVGQLLLGTFMTLTLLPFLAWLQVPFALLFAVFIGVMELFPFVGATIGIGTVVVIVATLNTSLALQVLILTLVVQQIKDNVVAPRVFGNFTGLNPVLIFSALLLGARVGGLLGIILAIPLTGVVISIYEIVVDPTLPPQAGSFFRQGSLSSLAPSLPADDTPVPTPWEEQPKDPSADPSSLASPKS